MSATVAQGVGCRTARQEKVLSQKLKQLGGSGERYTMQRPPIDKAKK